MFWSPFSDGAAVIGLAAGATNALIIGSIIEAEVGKEFEGYTVTRIIGTLFFNGGVNSELLLTTAINVQQEDISVNAITPVNDPSADWLYHQDHVAMARTDSTHTDRVNIDLRGQRKARGMDSEIRWFVENRSGQVINIHRTGRVLIKRA